jgi:hypothetical protein
MGGPPPASTASFYLELADHDDSFFAKRRELAHAFDLACGDTFCEGDFPDIAALRLACVVNQNTERVSRCGWSFAGADVSVDSRGALYARTMTKRCDLPVGATATQLATALSGDAPLHAPLPGKTTSIQHADRLSLSRLSLRRSYPALNTSGRCTCSRSSWCNHPRTSRPLRTSWRSCRRRT